MGSERPRRSPRAYLHAALGLAAWSCSADVDVVFVPLSVSFESASSSSSEGDPNSSVDLVLSAPAPRAFSLSLTVSDQGASGHDDCGARDYSVPTQRVRFEAGQRHARVELRHLDDPVSEADEHFSLGIEPNDAVTLGQPSTHTHRIVDDDRSLLADVQADFGAQGDGLGDDTIPIQQAIDRAAANVDAVVYFPPGRYVVGTLRLAPGVHLVGDRAVLTRAPDQPRDLQSAVLDYAGEVDSQATLIQGLVFDGNQAEQAGGFEDWEYRDADLLVLRGGNATAGRLRFSLQDVAFRNSGASGVRIGPNVDGELCSIDGMDVFTDLVQFGSGNSRLRIRHLSASGEVGTTGLALRSSERGHDESLRVEVELSDIELQTGDLHISVSDDSVVSADRLEVAAAPLFIRAPHSSVTIRDSSFVVGPALYEFNRIVAPSNLRFEDVHFRIGEAPERTQLLGEAARELRALDVLWNDAQVALAAGATDRVSEVISNQLLVCERCSFERAEDVEDSDTLYAVGTTAPLGAQDSFDPGSNNRIELREPSLGVGIAAALAPSCTGCSVAE